MRKLLFLVILALGSGLVSCKEKDIVITVTPKDATIQSGSSTELETTLKVDGQAVVGRSVDFSASGCGKLDKSSVTTIMGSGIAGGNPGDVPTVTFTGDSPDSTCKATITVTSGSGKKTCEITVTPLPRVVDIPGAPATASGAAPVVTITPDVDKSAKGFKATYTIKSDPDWPLQLGNVDVAVVSNISSSPGTTNPPASQLTKSAIISSFPADTTNATVTITSEGKPGGTADFDLRVGSSSNRKVVVFSAAALGKLTPKQPPLPGPKL